MNETVVREWFDRVDSDKSGSITALQLKVTFYLFSSIMIGFKHYLQF